MTTRVLAVDLQHIFAAGPWAAPGFDRIVDPVRRLVGANESVFTRFVAPAEPTGAWVGYYRQWPFALQPADAPDYALVDAFADRRGSTVDATTFGKWDAVAAAVDPEPGDRFLVCGVSTDCCVLSTVLAAADAGMAVQVVADACAGVDGTTHRDALAVMALYAPLVEIVTVEQVLGSTPR
jgi:nicotinamidase-related amidase